ncbi:MAG: branched-chain amino acid ABC transporter permease [Acidimicrobiales bacterium]
MLILQGIVDGILIGGLYALMGAGLTLVFGVMEIINFAQGILVILGAYLSYSIVRTTHIDPFVTILITIPAMFLLGYGIYYLLIARIKRDRVVMSLLVMFAVAEVIEGVLDLTYGGTLIQIHASYVDTSVHLGAINFPLIYVYAFLLSAVLMGFVYVVLYQTKFGRSLRATTQNPAAAQLVGIDVHRVSAATLGIGVGLAAAGGMLYGATSSFDAASSYDLISRLLVIVILGGFGSVGGAMAAAIIMVVIQDVVAVTWSPVWGQTMFYLVLVLGLLFKPEGIFGRQIARAQ